MTSQTQQQPPFKDLPPVAQHSLQRLAHVDGVLEYIQGGPYPQGLLEKSKTTKAKRWGRKKKTKAPDEEPTNGD